jgi:hypothetical protein
MRCLSQSQLGGTVKNPQKKQYRKPEIQDFGTVTDLTATGKTNPGPDAKGGSAASQGA